MGEAIKDIGEHEIIARQINTRIVCRACNGPVMPASDGRAELVHVPVEKKPPYPRRPRKMNRREMQDFLQSIRSATLARGGLGDEISVEIEENEG